MLHFGYYLWPDEGEYEAIICGDELTHELWEQAKKSFAKHGGRRKNDLEPEKSAVTTPMKKATQPDKVVFVREDRHQKMGQTMLYRIYQGSDADSAKEFLTKTPVDKNFYYLVVETPEGNYCRDIKGMYKE